MMAHHGSIETTEVKVATGDITDAAAMAGNIVVTQQAKIDKTER